MLAEKQFFLERAFRILNEIYYNNLLPEPIITIQSSRNAYGHFTLDKIWKSSSDSRHEINISCEFLSRPIPNILSTLQHELVHNYCLLNGITDTSKRGRYHNKRFKAEAEKRGLKIEYVQYIGWSKTSPTDEFISVLEDNGLLDIEMDEYRIGAVQQGENGTPTTGKIKKPSSSRKLQCPKCGISVRATKDVLIACIPCVALLERVD